MTSPKDIISNLKDNTYITFESVGYRFKGVMGYDIASTDYTYSDNILMIKASYLKLAFESNPERTSLILSYTFEKDNLTHLGFITIKKL